MDAGFLVAIHYLNGWKPQTPQNSIAVLLPLELHSFQKLSRLPRVPEVWQLWLDLLVLLSGLGSQGGFI